MRVLLLAVSLTLTACATPYKSHGFMGGFTDRQLSADVFMVTFQGNGYTTDTRARDFLLLRCADLTLEHGWRYFRLVGGANDSKDGAAMVATGNTAFIAPIHFPSQSASIQIRAEREGPQDFDAEIIAKSMRDTYGIK